MPLTDEIKAKVTQWLNFVNALGPVSEEELLRMEVILEELSLLRHTIDPSVVLEITLGGLDAPKPDQEELRKRITGRFPILGLYNIPQTVTDEPMGSAMMMGDAIDDLLDITNEMVAAQWHFQQGRPHEALWEFAFGYDHHWRYHMRCLLWYLEMRRFETP